MKQLRELIGKQVEVGANGTVYKGTLKYVSGESAGILTTSGWIEIMMSAINRIEEAGEAGNDQRQPPYRR